MISALCRMCRLKKYQPHYENTVLNIFFLFFSVRESHNRELLVHNAKITFKEISEDNFDLVASVFKDLIEPNYGDQSSAIEKIKQAKDRRCELACHDGQAIGMIVYKTDLQEEYQFKNAFEIKTLLLFDRDAYKGFGEHLFQRVESIAKNMGADVMISTVSDSLPKILKKMMANNWHIVKASKSGDCGVDVKVAVKDVQPLSVKCHRILDFMHLCENIKTEKRHGKTSDNHPDRVASHSWRMAVGIMMVAPYLQHRINVLKAIKISLIHDLAEAVTGDQPYFCHAFDQEEKLKKDRRERFAMSSISEMLPVGSRIELISLWQEYEDQQSIESKVVKAMDKIEAQIQHNEADISVWNEFDINNYASYLNKFCDIDESLSCLKNIIQGESREKLSKNNIKLREVETIV